MNAQANARASSAARYMETVPVLRASQAFTDRELGILRLAATWPTRAKQVAEELGRMAARQPLDAELKSLLKQARATASRFGKGSALKLSAQH